jgi:ArsR family transcriptional regulator
MRIQTAATPTHALFCAAADKTRLRILSVLLRGELCVCEVVDALRIQQTRASRHL